MALPNMEDLKKFAAMDNLKESGGGEGESVGDIPAGVFIKAFCAHRKKNDYSNDLIMHVEIPDVMRGKVVDVIAEAYVYAKYGSTDNIVSYADVDLDNMDDFYKNLYPKVGLCDKGAYEAQYSFSGSEKIARTQLMPTAYGSSVTVPAYNFNNYPQHNGAYPSTFDPSGLVRLRYDAIDLSKWPTAAYIEIDERFKFNYGSKGYELVPFAIYYYMAVHKEADQG